MSIIKPITKRCGNCGNLISFYSLGSTSAFGTPDLDWRPPELARHTMSMWLEECPDCGYINKNISTSPKFDKEYLSSEEYISCGGIKFSAELSKTFYRMALLSLLTNSIIDAYNNILYAAWCCDDSNDTENAVLCRRKMDKLFSQLPKYFQSKADPVVRHIDVLRRAGKFDKAISMCDSVETDDKQLISIVKFQKEKCIGHDTAVYTVEDAIKADNNNEEIY